MPLESTYIHLTAACSPALMTASSSKPIKVKGCGESVPHHPYWWEDSKEGRPLPSLACLVGVLGVSPRRKGCPEMTIEGRGKTFPHIEISVVLTRRILVFLRFSLPKKTAFA